MGATEWALLGNASTHNFTSNQDALVAVGFNGLTDDGSEIMLQSQVQVMHAAVNTAMDNLALQDMDSRYC